jgi:AraC-like DNA-binding protein
MNKKDIVLNKKDKMANSSADTVFEIRHCKHIPKYICNCRNLTEFYELQFIEDGGVELSFDGKHYELEGGSGWLVRPGILYCYSPLGKHGWWNHRYIVFRGARCAEWLAAGILPKEPFRAPARLNFPERLDRVIDLSRDTEDAARRLETANILEGIFLDIHKNSGPDTEPGWLFAVYRELDKNSAPDYRGIASRVGMSQRTLARKFFARTGVTLHQAYIRGRADTARRLLETTGMTVKEIAENLCFADAAHFTRSFKALTGATPAAFRSGLL